MKTDDIEFTNDHEPPPGPEAQFFRVAVTGKHIATGITVAYPRKVLRFSKSYWAARAWIHDELEKQVPSS